MKRIASCVISVTERDNITGLLYDKSLIVAVESDTMETSLVHCLEHCYSCCALVIIRGNELLIFPGIALYRNNKYILLLLLLLLLLLSIRHTNQGVVVQIRKRNTEVWLRQKTNHKKLSWLYVQRQNWIDHLSGNS